MHLLADLLQGKPLQLYLLLDAAQQEHGKSPGDSHTATRSIKSYVQLGKLVLTLVGAVIIVATLIDRGADADLRESFRALGDIDAL